MDGLPTTIDVEKFTEVCGPNVFGGTKRLNTSFLTAKARAFEINAMQKAMKSAE